MRTALAVLVMLLLGAGLLGAAGQPAAPAAAAAAMPLATVTPAAKRGFLPLIMTKPALAYSTSLYMGSLATSFAYTYGCQTGARDLANPGTQQSLIILAYGQAWVEDGVYGIWNYSGPFGSLARVAASAREFARGYWVCSGSDDQSHITLGIGINNFGSFTDDGSCTPKAVCARNHGERWAQLVAETDQWVLAQGYGQQITVTGAIDIEQGWNTAAVSKAWVDGFDAKDQGKYIYYNFGTCTNCPTRLAPNLVPENGWTPWDVYYVSYGVPPSWPIPEIYVNNGLNARQWAYLSHLAATYWGAPIYFPGLMTEWQACQQYPSGCDQIDNTPQEGYNQLMSELAYWPQTEQGEIPLVTDIKWTPRQTDSAGLPAAAPLSQADAAASSAIPPEKLAMLQQLAEGRAADTPAAKPAQSAALPELEPPAPRPAGILERGRPPLSGMAFEGLNAWAGEVNGTWTVIFAGYDPQDAAQGLLVLYLPDAGYLSMIPAPTRGGALTVTGFADGRLTLRDASGAELMFDVSDSEFHVPGATGQVPSAKCDVPGAAAICSPITNH